ncbi:serine/threonine-protein kinase [Nannocystis pusilla]|uniref:Protein kinase n=1 Tax=Nannocystis pusilla TaxID=889268 RepID=A0ABS7TSB7_9BACT|nr:serine/threonine-protein kinase [Nannocystis pusilla]MBZ5711111.1 protein kinase [Nannocystis pusilla]
MRAPAKPGSTGEMRAPVKPPGSTGEMRAPVKPPGATTGEMRSKQPASLGGEPAKPAPGRARSPTRSGTASLTGATPAAARPVTSTGAAAARPAPAKPPAPIGPGSVIDGRYKLEQPLGSGGMSTVYRGTHARTGGKLAIKLLDPRLSGKADMQQRCLAEARAMMDISSNHVVRAYDVGQTPSGQVYIVMEYLEGEDLDHLLQREGPLPWHRLANMAVQICSGLSSAHAKGTYHRDIKPQNCFRVTLDRNPDHVKLIDFGIAKDTNSGQELTQDGVLLGTPEYMAPELIATNATPDARSDIYAVGATLYKLITGTPPFSSKNVLDLLYHQKHTAPEAPSKRAPERGIPPIADQILLRTLEKDPDKRYQTADEFGQALLESLDAVVGGPVVRHRSQPFLVAIPERSRPGTTPIGTPAPNPTPQGGTPRPGATPLGTPTLDDAEGATHSGEPAVRDEVSRSQQYDTVAPRPITGKDVAARGGTLLSLALVFGLASWVAAPAPSPADAAAAAAAADDPEPEPVKPEEPASPPNEPPPALSDSTAAAVEPTRVEEPPPEPTNVDAPPVPEDTKTDAPPVVADTKVEVPPPEPTKVEAPPPVPEDTKAPEPTPAAPPAAGQPDPDFGYRNAEKELRSQHKFFQTCLDDAGQSTSKLKFTIEVRKSGMPPHKIKVISSNAAVRACVRGLFEQFPFDSSPRGGAFSYSYSNGKATFERLPLSNPSN